MKTKQIPFNLGMAKKIQEGEIKGEIKTKCGNIVRILCFDLIDPRDVSFPMVCALYNDKSVRIVRFTKCGRYSGAINSELDLVLEVPDTKPQFKPFDKVLVRDSDTDVWVPALYQFYSERGSGERHHLANDIFYIQCIPYEGNEHLVGTTDKPKED